VEHQKNLLCLKVSKNRGTILKQKFANLTPFTAKAMLLKSHSPISLSQPPSQAFHGSAIFTESFRDTLIRNILEAHILNNPRQRPDLQLIQKLYGGIAVRLLMPVKDC